MRSTRLRSSFFAALLGATAAVAPASAQSPSCDRIRSELAMLDQSGGAGSAQYGREIQRQRTEADRLSAYARSIGCQNRQFLIFGSPPPPQCGGVKARIAALKSQSDVLESRASGDSPQRRALRAHYDAVCNPAPREKNFFEQLFGGGNDQSVRSEEHTSELQSRCSA
jgi:hypothetical protein